MSRKARAITAATIAAVAFIALFAVGGYYLGIEQYTGWPAALMVGGIAAGGIAFFAVLLAVTVVVAEWISRGEA